jgi:anhydro-N-acetylmuramic acid kinase
MNKLFELSQKDSRKVIGLMSGTSVDGVDAALVEITGNGINTKIDLLGFIEYSYPPGLKDVVLKNSVRESSNIEEISQLNFLLPKFYFDAIQHLMESVNIPLGEVDLIGSHGQTIHHLPNHIELFGKEVSSTMQIGDPSVLSKLTGVITVGNFRSGDVALGGQGAPLVPYFDYLLFHSDELNRCLLNIGGISNITLLKKSCSQTDVLAFDTGPGNMMIDFLMKRFYNKDYDENGSIASSGSLNQDLFNALVVRDSFIESDPPKSTGREYYGEVFLNELLDEFENISKEDWLNTITNFTAYAVHRNYNKFIEPETKIEELIISGGGAKNSYLYKCLADYFGNSVQVKVIDEIGISSDAKEAICFAVLANETLSGNPGNIPRTTGASRSTILGGIYLP